MFKRLYSRYVNRAKRRKHIFELTINQFRDIVTSSCVYCGVGAIYTEHRSDSKTKGNYSYTGIDRVDSSKGYTLDNCVACCRMCNRAKHLTPLKEFEAWLDQVVFFRRQSTIPL